MGRTDAAIQLCAWVLCATLSACGAAPQGGGMKPKACAVEPEQHLVLTEQQQVRGAGFLELGISSSDHRGPASAYIKLTLRNLSNESLWIGYRMTTGPGGDVSLQATDKNGAVLSQTECFAKMAPRSSADYMVLLPLAEVSQVRPLDCFPFGHPGSWTVVAVYQTGESPLVPPPTGAKWFGGATTSNSLVIELEPSAVSRAHSADPSSPNAAPAAAPP